MYAVDRPRRRKDGMKRGRDLVNIMREEEAESSKKKDISEENMNK